MNRILKQAALLHTDIALLKLEAGKFSVPSNQIRVAFIDGRLVRQPYKPHWEFARRLINAVDPSPAEDPMARQWYIASTAHMQSLRDLANARKHLEDALKLFPDDAQILFYAGVLHEIWASPLNQNFQSNLPVKPFYGSKEKELKQARKFYREVIDADPDFAEAYLRLGRVEGLLDSHPQAFVALERADSLIQEPLLSYYTALFRGYEFEMLDRPEEAREQYERASSLYPGAQSPRLALSPLAHSLGDTESALDALRNLLDLQQKETGRDDPFWEYDLSHVRNAPDLIEKMHRVFGELPQ
ncbi:MAG: tetratricopeptide repeat protein [Acidobacteriota bacterium]